MQSRIFRPQFSIRSFLIVAALSAFAIHWWTSTPRRAAIEFVTAVASRNPDSIDEFYLSHQILEETWRLDDAKVGNVSIRPSTRSIVDMFFGRLECEVVFFGTDGARLDTMKFDVSVREITNARSTSEERIFSFMIANL